MGQTHPIYSSVVFDFGGVLVDWDARYLYRKFFNGDSAALERFLSEVHFLEWNLQQDKGRSFAAGVAELSAQFPHYADLIQAYDQRWEESISGPIQSAVDILRLLKEAGYHLYGMTNWSSEKFYQVRPKYEFFSWFETIVVSGEVKLIKPDRRIFELFLAKIDRTAAECVYIDDSAVNVVAAAQLGFKTIHFESPEQLKVALHELGVLRQSSQR